MNVLPTIHMADIVTLSEVAIAITHLPFPQKRKVDLISDLNQIAKWKKLPLTQIPADAKELREFLAGIHPLQLGISAKRLANIRSSAKAGLKAVRCHVAKPSKQKNKYSPEWKAFLEGLETKWQRHTLARLAAYCSTHGHKPSDVCDAILDRLQAVMQQEEVGKEPKAICKRMVQTWNGAVSRIGLQLPLLTARRDEQYRAIRLTEFPESFQADAQAYLSRLEMKDILEDTGDDGKRRPAAPLTLKNVHRIICQFATALVHRGVMIDAITSLAALVEVANFKEAVRFYLERNEGAPPSWLWTMLGQLIPIAKYHVKVSPEELNALKAIRSKCKLDEDSLLSEKNRLRLAQFEDVRNFDRLLLLPEQLMFEAERRRKAAEAVGKSSSRAGLLAMYAVAVAILLAAPIRAKNLANINLSVNLKWHGKGNSQTLTLYIPGPTTKNKVTFEGPIPHRTAQLIRHYIQTYRNLICKTPGDWLFPWPSGEPRAPSSLAEDMCKLIWRKTGIDMHAHLFRHLAGLMWLRHHPGDYETVRQMLNHKKIETTINFYTGLDAKRALARYHDEVLSKKPKGK